MPDIISLFETKVDGFGTPTEYLKYGANLGNGQTLGVISGNRGCGIPDIVVEAFSKAHFEISHCYFFHCDMVFVPVRLNASERILVKGSTVSGLSFSGDIMPSKDSYLGSRPLTVDNLPSLPFDLYYLMSQSRKELTQAANHRLSSQIMHASRCA